MNKKYTLIVLVLLIFVLAGGVYFWKTKMQKSATGTTEDISKGVLPAIDTGVVNPTESAQGANPYDKTNPFSNIKVNPFE